MFIHTVTDKSIILHRYSNLAIITCLLVLEAVVITYTNRNFLFQIKLINDFHMLYNSSYIFDHIIKRKTRPESYEVD